ncbi:RsiV family protein [Nocardia sp. NPDC005978]|uniref:RsiV family protein n=1 Tax=Nocardia sp. NPDC005978 TaxID=3156725 RepID=UPI0033B14006
MRIRTATVAGIAALALSLTACEDGTTTVPVTTGPGTTATTSATTATTTVTTRPGSSKLTAASVRVNGSEGRVSYDVRVPQLEPGTGAAAAEFNASMRELLRGFVSGHQVGDEDPAVSITDPNGRSAVEHIGGRAVSGLLWVSFDGGGAHPWSMLASHVTDLRTGEAIGLGDLFTDSQAGLDVLAAQAAELGPKTRAGDAFDPRGASASSENFQVWTATPDGMRIYFEQGSVGPSAMGVVDITVPWSELSAVLAPGMQDVLAG